MKNIVVLFNLKSGVDANAYEAWAASTDLPIENIFAIFGFFATIFLRKLSISLYVG